MMTSPTHGIAAVVACVALFSVGLQAQDGPRPTELRDTAQSEAVRKALSETPKIRLFRQSITRESSRLALVAANEQQSSTQQRSWVARHKVLVAVLIGVGVVAVWGALDEHACAHRC